jgi:hypothetical protein
MFALVLVALFLLVAVTSLLGLTADSRDLRPRLPVQAGGEQPEPGWTERLADTALTAVRTCPAAPAPTAVTCRWGPRG